MKVDEFKDRMIKDLEVYNSNISTLNKKELSETTFLKHFENFKNWMEIGTYMESEYYPDGNPN